jgi:prolipoprotein diacylglyceryltransferase
MLLASGRDGWAVAAGLAASAPWVQAIGRLRCLVQGCCHGARCERGAGIVYRQPRSRVCFVAKLGGIPLHPTPLYSIAANLAIGSLLMRLWMVHAPASFLIGAYMILQGLARFVEESRRGEPQTQMLGPLRIYQLFAAMLAVLGALLTAIPSPAVDAALVLSGAGWAGAIGVGLLYGAAMGVDFPASNRRFSRLA